MRPLAVWHNRRAWLHQRYRVRTVEEKGWQRVRDLCRAGDSVLLAPNHSDHADPHAIMEVGHRYRLPLRFMAARELFDKSALVSWVMQHLGVFSVDRDGPDVASLKTAIQILSRGCCPLVVFPEGEIYHHHARLDPLMEGVASILLRAARKLPEGRSAWLVPVAMTFRHDAEVEAGFSERLSRLEDRIGWKPRPAMPIDERIVRLGAGILSLKELEFFGESGAGGLAERLGALCQHLLEDVEERRGKDNRAGTPPERVRALRYRIRRCLLDETNPAGADEKRALMDDLYRAFTALQAHSYPGDYLLEHPSLHRRAETLMKLEEDLLGECQYQTWRTARVVAGQPIAVSAMLHDGSLTAKCSGKLTHVLEDKLGALIASEWGAGEGS